MDSLTTFDYLNEDRVDALRKFREQINQRNDDCKIQKIYNACFSRLPR